jgi:hypothetical protein
VNLVISARTDVHPQQTVADVHAVGFVGEELGGDLGKTKKGISP